MLWRSPDSSVCLLARHTKKMRQVRRSKIARKTPIEISPGQNKFVLVSPLLLVTQKFKGKGSLFFIAICIQGLDWTRRAGECDVTWTRYCYAPIFKFVCFFCLLCYPEGPQLESALANTAIKSMSRSVNKVPKTFHETYILLLGTRNTLEFEIKSLYFENYDFIEVASTCFFF